jgi:hypothetical protein
MHGDGNGLQIYKKNYSWPDWTRLGRFIAFWLSSKHFGKIHFWAFLNLETLIFCWLLCTYYFNYLNCSRKNKWEIVLWNNNLVFDFGSFLFFLQKIHSKLPTQFKNIIPIFLVQKNTLHTVSRHWHCRVFLKNNFVWNKNRCFVPTCILGWVFFTIL